MTAKQVMAILKENGWTLNRINGSHHIFTGSLAGSGYTAEHLVFSHTILLIIILF
jgi:predicted RNA binding protein YcfA (HicA-like mRNA interferase family)